MSWNGSSQNAPNWSGVKYGPTGNVGPTGAASTVTGPTGNTGPTGSGANASLWSQFPALQTVDMSGNTLSKAPSIINTGNISMFATSGDITITADETTNVFSESDVNIVAQHGNRGRVNITADEGYLNGVGGEIHLLAKGGANPFGIGSGGLIDLIATTTGTGLTSAIRISAASVLAYAGIVSPLASLAGYMYSHGSLGTNTIAGSLSVLPNIPGTNYLYGSAGTLLPAGTRVENGLGTDRLVPLDSGGLVVGGTSAWPCSLNIITGIQGIAAGMSITNCSNITGLGTSTGFTLNEVTTLNGNISNCFLNGITSLTGQTGVGASLNAIASFTGYGAGANLSNVLQFTGTVGGAGTGATMDNILAINNPHGDMDISGVLNIRGTNLTMTDVIRIDGDVGIGMILDNVSSVNNLFGDMVVTNLSNVNGMDYNTYGSFLSSNTQAVVGANTPTQILFDFQNNGNRTSLLSNAIKVSSPGNYELNLSLQLQNQNPVDTFVDFWVKLNNVDVRYSASRTMIFPVLDDFALATTTVWLSNLIANDIIDVYFASPDANVRLIYDSGFGSLFSRPESPSIRASIRLVSV